MKCIVKALLSANTLCLFNLFSFLILNTGNHCLYTFSCCSLFPRNTSFSLKHVKTHILTCVCIYVYTTVLTLSYCRYLKLWRSHYKPFQKRAICCRGISLTGVLWAASLPTLLLFIQDIFLCTHLNSQVFQLSKRYWSGTVLFQAYISFLTHHLQFMLCNSPGVHELDAFCMKLRWMIHYRSMVNVLHWHCKCLNQWPGCDNAKSSRTHSEFMGRKKIKI